MCIGKEEEYENVKRHIQDVLRWLRSKKRLITTALDLARPAVSPHAARLAQEAKKQASGTFKRATRESKRPARRFLAGLIWLWPQQIAQIWAHNPKIVRQDSA